MAYPSTIDDDLQNPPEEIPRLLDTLAEGHDVVYGVPRQQRHGLWHNMATWAGGVAAGAAALGGLLPGTGVHLLLYLLTALFGLTLGTLGIIGEFAVRIYYAARKNPRYLIAEVIE